MDVIQEQKIKQAFELYLRNVNPVIHELQFWNDWLKRTIDDYLTQEVNPRPIFTYLKAATYESQTGVLKITNDSITLYNRDLQKHREEFLRWIMNMSIVKSYNALELFLLQSIQISEFTHLANPIEGPAEMNAVENEICDYLKNKGLRLEKKNNKFILEFLKDKFHPVTPFLDNDIRIDIGNTWEEFFIMISIVRHIVVHNAMIVANDTRNSIRSISKMAFDSFFNLDKDADQNSILSPKEGDTFRHLISLINELTINMARMILGENDLHFLGMS